MNYSFIILIFLPYAHESVNERVDDTSAPCENGRKYMEICIFVLFVQNIGQEEWEVAEKKRSENRQNHSGQSSAERFLQEF